jgi:hypothetical protein
MFAARHNYRLSERAWTEPDTDDAWLVLDRNGDGAINDASELFGDNTPQPIPPEGEERNGFLALSQFDDNGDDIIDEKDDIYTALRLWQDKNHDGVSQTAELFTLYDLGVAGVSMAYSEDRQADKHGNLFRYKAAVYGVPGSTVGMTAWDVWLTGTVPEPIVGDDEIETIYGCGGTMNPNITWCINACRAGTASRETFCRAIPQPHIRAACWAVVMASLVACEGFCYNYY